MGDQPGVKAYRGLADQCWTTNRDRGNNKGVSTSTHNTGNGSCHNNMVRPGPTKDLGQRTCPGTVQVYRVISTAAINDHMLFSAGDIHCPTRTTQAGFFQQDHIGALRAVELDPVHIATGHKIDLGIEQVAGFPCGLGARGKAAQDNVILSCTAFDPQIRCVGIDLDPVAATAAADQGGMGHTWADPAPIHSCGQHPCQGLTGEQIRGVGRSRWEELTNNNVVITRSGVQNRRRGVVFKHHKIVATRGLKQ